MRAKLATIVTVLVCASTALSVTLPAATATAAKPLICEAGGCGSWGAKEHAKAFAEQHGLRFVEIEGCKKNSEYGAQWVCWGTGWDESNNRWHFHVWINEYGYERHWTWDGVG